MTLLTSFFFFSSRRRHTRCSRDWSSDVCSSDLPTGWPQRSARDRRRSRGRRGERQQRLPHLRRRLPPLLARLGERAGDGGGERLRHVAPQPAQVGGRVVLLHVEHGGGAGRGERRPARERLEQHYAERIEVGPAVHVGSARRLLDRKSTRLNSSHGYISYA